MEMNALIRHVMCRRTRIVLAAAVLLVSSGAAGARGASADSVCVQFEGTRGVVRLEIDGDYALTGTLPAILCNLTAGVAYRIIVEGYGIEPRIGRFGIDPDGAPRAAGISGGIALRNVVPGLGTIYAGHPWTGVVDIGSVAASAVVLAREHMHYMDLRDDYDAKQELLASSMSLDAIETLAWEVNVAARKANTQNTYRKRLLIFSGYLYAHQIVEPFFFFPAPRIRIDAGGTVADVTPTDRSAVKAMLFSLFLPGRGQFYQGKTGRGVIYSSLFVAAGLNALDFHNRYDKDANRYQLAVEMFNAATYIEHKKYYHDRANIAWRAVEDSKRKRNTMYIICAGIWGLSLLDTLIPPAESKGVEERYSFEMGPAGGALVVRF
jgi:hypothetical protein